jgi:uncharacterized damage-inducible protein DinB
LYEASGRLIAAIETIDRDQWPAVPTPGEWSVGRESEHVVEAGAYHRWIVRLTIGEKVSSRGPVLERSQMTPNRAPADVVELIRASTANSARLILALIDEQLDLPTRPPRARGQRLGETIDRVLIDHYDAHRAAIEAKLSRA